MTQRGRTNEEAGGGVGDPLADPLAPETLVDRYGARIYRVARRMTRSEADAEDVTQNTLLKVFQKSRSFRGESDPMGWIYRITMNEARELHRRRARRPAVSLDTLPLDFDASGHVHGVRDFSGRPDRDLLRAEIEETVTRAIEELPDGYREAVVLMDIEGLTYKEAARVLDLTLGGFKTRLHRARLHLRRRLQSFWQSVDQGHEAAEKAGGSR
ncbi:MAG: RNA polymerase sigma factor [Planctomycetota bacterium]